MIEKTVLDYLEEKLLIPVYFDTPVEAPKKYVIVAKTGSKKKNQICTSMMIFQSIAPTILEAAQLNEEIKTAIESLINLETITRVELNSDYNFTNTATKQPRYQAVFDITHY